MPETAAVTTPSAQQNDIDMPPRRFWACAMLVGAAYAVLLTQSMHAPWIGLHDWNGAFFSQLARNLNRYPMSLHHGIPMAAVGAEIPPPEQRSLYATHPPGLPWLVAASFRIFGDSEFSARLVPIAASVGTLVILMVLGGWAFGCRIGLLAGAFYAVMPMSVYFGRMVDHEPVCLFAMVAAACSWSARSKREISTSRSVMLEALTGSLLAMGCWLDWSACLFAAIFCIWISFGLIRGRAVRTAAGAHGRSPPGFGPVLTVIFLFVIGLLGMILHLVYAGLAGRWADLVAVFLSRTTRSPDASPGVSLAPIGDAWRHTLENTGIPLLILAAIGLTAMTLHLRRRASVVRSDASGIAGAEQNDRRHASRGSLTMIAITGAVWLALFPRQYAMHHYWMFYLGPAVALSAAIGVNAVFTRISGRWVRNGRTERTNWRLRNSPAFTIVAVIVLGTLTSEMSGQALYFGYREPVLARHVEAWKAISNGTLPADRIMVFSDRHLWIERRGEYVFRNIIPPQFAYYADRAFVVEMDPERILNQARDFALFVMPVADAVRLSGSLGPLRQHFREQLLYDSLVVFDLRHDFSKDPTAKSGDLP